MKPAHIELTYEIQSVRPRAIQVAPADSARIGEKLARGKAAFWRADREGEIEASQEWVGCDPGDRDVEAERDHVSYSGNRYVAVTAREQHDTSQYNDCS